MPVKMLLPQVSAEVARSVATVLRSEGWSCLIRGDDKHGWFVEVLGDVRQISEETDEPAA